MYAATVPVVMHALDRAEALLQKASPEMLDTRLAPGMFDFAEQLSTVAGFALRATFPLTDRAMPQLVEVDPGADIAAARLAIRDLTEADFEGAEGRWIKHRAGFADLNQSAQEYLQLFALPNLWFHLSMAYAILRQAGVDVGKADFDGLHAYPPDFTF